MRPELAALRRDYALAGLSETDLAGTWLTQFEGWLAEAAGLTEPNAMVLGTVADGVPSARTVLLKAVDEQGFVFFTNRTSRKGRELAQNPRASLVFPWIDLERQVVVTGSVEAVSETESSDYFRSRPRASQLGAWASYQSSAVTREELEARYAELELRWEGQDVPMPPFWGGLRVVPDSVEFWQGRPSRLHDRLRYRLSGDAWVVERLSP
jgi:pyridoxamine 5'-phosphate oxidase